MKLVERQIGDVTVLDLQGRLVFEEEDALRARLNALVAEPRPKIVLNLAGVTYIDSCGVGVLISKFVSLRRIGGDLKLANLSPRVRHVLEICGLLDVFDTFDMEGQAVTSFADTQGV